MSDLKGRQLQNSYQDVLTRGSGNRIEDGDGNLWNDLDDKASLSQLEEKASISTQQSLSVGELIRRSSSTGSLSNGNSLTIDFTLTNDRSNTVHINARFTLRSGVDIFCNHRVIVAAIDGGINEQISTEIIGKEAGDYPISFSHVSGATYRITATNNSGTTRFITQLVAEISAGRDMSPTS